MARFSFDGYRRQWPRVGGVLAMALGGVTALAAGKMSKPQTLSAVNFGALLVHQYEEYQDPGWFPGQFNHGLFHSVSPGQRTRVCPPATASSFVEAVAALAPTGDVS